MLLMILRFASDTAATIDGGKETKSDHVLFYLAADHGRLVRINRCPSQAQFQARSFKFWNCIADLHVCWVLLRRIRIWSLRTVQLDTNTNCSYPTNKVPYASEIGGIREDGTVCQETSSNTTLSRYRAT